MSQDRDSHDRDRDRDRVWEIVEKVGVCMLATQFEGGLRARPLEARPERDAGLIWFVTDIRSGKEQEIEAEHDGCLVFIRRQGRGLPFHHRPRRGAA